MVCLSAIILYVRKYDDVQQYHNSKEDYDTQVAAISQSIGPGTYDFNDLMDLGDFFLKQAPGAALNRRIFTVAKNRPAVLKAQKKAFTEKLTGILESGNPASYYFRNHYVTITGINGNIVEYNERPFIVPFPEDASS